jgi:F-type H+-transporting ATPase subunit gamma
MSDSAASLRHKIASAGDLESVVGTMKAMAAASVGQYENAVRSLENYARTVELGLAACFRQEGGGLASMQRSRQDTGATGAVVFGSDQGLVGQFNEDLMAFAVQTLDTLPGNKTVWAVGERLQSQLADTALPMGKSFVLPGAIGAITSLVGQILIEIELQREVGTVARVYLFHNRPRSGALYTPVVQRMLPLDSEWQRDIAAIPWPSRCLPEVMNGREQTVLALVREYIFVTLFRACAESLASENASRLAAMQRAEKNIDELLDDLKRNFHRVRQSSIDEELFDVVSGFEALANSHKP